MVRPNSKRLQTRLEVTQAVITREIERYIHPSVSCRTKLGSANLRPLRLTVTVPFVY